MNFIEIIRGYCARNKIPANAGMPAIVGAI